MVIVYYALFTKMKYNKYPKFTAWTKSKKLIRKAYRHRKEIGTECFIASVKNEDAKFYIDNELKYIEPIFGCKVIDTESSYMEFTELFQDAILPSILDSLYILNYGLSLIRNSDIYSNIEYLSNSILCRLNKGPSWLGDKMFYSNIYKLNIEEIYNEYLRGEWS